MTASVALDHRPPEPESIRVAPRPTRQDDRPVRLVRSTNQRVRRWGTSSVTPFALGADRQVHDLCSGGLVSIVRQGRWAVMAGDPIAPPGRERQTLDDAMELMARLQTRPAFVAVVDETPYRERGMWTFPIADDALVDLAGFTLAGKRMASLRHSVSAAARAGLSVAGWSPAFGAEAEKVSAEWLATKRGGELGFTLGRFDPAHMDGLDGRAALDRDGRVVGLVTWHSYDNGRGRVLDLMRRTPDAPNPTMDFLIAQSLTEFAAAGVATASLGSVPRSRGRLAERIYPTVSLRRYKNKFAPRWEPRYLAAPGRASVPAALVAVARAYSPEGLRAACRRNR